MFFAFGLSAGPWDGGGRAGVHHCALKPDERSSPATGDVVPASTGSLAYVHRVPLSGVRRDLHVHARQPSPGWRLPAGAQVVCLAYFTVTVPTCARSSVLPEESCTVASMV